MHRNKQTCALQLIDPLNKNKKVIQKRDYKAQDSLISSFLFVILKPEKKLIQGNERQNLSVLIQFRTE